MPEKTIESLEAQLAAVTRENTRLVSENVRRKNTGRDQKTKIDTLTAELAVSNQDRDTYRKKAEKNPAENNEEMERLLAENRTFKHRDGLSELAYGEEIKLKKDIKIDLLMKMLDYRPESDEFDAKAAKKLLTSFKESNPSLFESATGGGDQSGRYGPAPLNPAVAALGLALGRGNSPNSLEGQVLSEETLRDPVAMSRWHAEQRQAMKK
jgi:hypothetical protein